MIGAAGLALYPAGVWLLGVVAILSGERALALGAFLLGVLWIPTGWLKRKRPLQISMLLAAAALSALGITAGLPTLVAVVCLTAAIYGWDLALVAGRLSAFPTNAVSPFAIRYLLISAALAAVGVGLAAMAQAWRTTLTFSLALGLAVGVLIVAGVLVRLARSALPADRADDHQ